MSYHEFYLNPQIRPKFSVERNHQTHSTYWKDSLHNVVNNPLILFLYLFITLYDDRIRSSNMKGYLTRP